MLAREHWREDIYDWQPALKRGIDFGILRPGPFSEAVVARISGEPVDEDTIADTLPNVNRARTWLAEGANILRSGECRE